MLRFEGCFPEWLRRRYRYCRMLEEGSFRGRTADFVFMFLFGGLLMTVSSLLLLLLLGDPGPVPQWA